ncbi:hypothetical protein H5410_023527 [Solanum commersonii]|uniref:Uncharacterized protein n=1 Tax=Solanum commersonii TaxID=4109 RepID=A0A9J5ZK33_SOLCO|nr:hypothetical protein H5410_023527 [Solanum commersonii]
MAIDICADHPSAFESEKAYCNLFHMKMISQENIPTKSRPCRMNTELVEFSQKKEIDNLLQKGLIKPSKSLLSALEFKLYKLIPPFCIIGVLDDEDPYDDLDELGDDLPLPRV